MCWKADVMIAATTCELAQKEWGLIQTINAEEKDHPGTIFRTRRILEERKDEAALILFNVLTNHNQPPAESELEKARALVDYADTISGADARD